MRKSLTSAAVLFGLSASLVAGATLPAIAATTLVGNGSSFQDDFQQKCITKFNADTKTGGGKKLGITVTYTKSSSGTGRAALAGGTAAFAGADSTGTEVSAANSVYIPIAAAPVAFFFNLKTSKGAAVTGLNLDSATLSSIFRGDIRYWDDSAIKNQNKAVSLPHNLISVQYRQGDSGTSKNMFKYFNATSGNSSAWGTSTGVWADQNKGTVVGTSNNGGPALVTSVTQTDNSIGYADLSDVTSSLKMVALKNAKGAYVKPTAAAATAFLKGAGVLTENGTYSGTYAIDWTTQVTGAYQFTILTYMVGSKANSNSDLKAYATYMIKNCSANPAGIGAPGFVTPGATVLAKATAQIAKL